MIYGFVIIVLFLAFRRGVVPTVTGWFRKRRRVSPPTPTEEATSREESLNEPA